MEGIDKLMLDTSLTDSQQKAIWQSRLLEVSSDVDKLNKMVYTGNGEPSLMERVRNLEKLAQKIERVSNALILQTIAFFFTMLGIGLSFFIKIYPLLVKAAEAAQDK